MGYWRRTGETDATLVGGYRGHPVHVPNHAAGRVLVHALRLLEEDPLSDMDAAARATMCSAAVAHAVREEARHTPLAQRLSLAAVDDFLAADPVALSATLQLPASTLGAPEALLVLDAAVGGAALCRAGFPLVLVRADRPALLVAAAGDDTAAAFALLQVVVATCALGAGLSSALADVSPARPCVAMLLDERGVFQAAGSPACSSGSLALIASTVAITFAPGWRCTFRMIAGVSTSPRPDHAPSWLFSALLTTRATSTS